MKEYIKPPIHELKKPVKHWQSGVDALKKTAGETGWPSSKLIKNELIKSALLYLTKGKGGVPEELQQNSFNQLMDVYYAKFLYINDMAASNQSLQSFIEDVFGEEFQSVRIG